MTVKSVREAWNIVNAIFPTDYEFNIDASEKAGYSIYCSSCEEDESWISDLGSRLEINLADGRSFNIWIDEITNRASMRLRKYLVYVEDLDNLFKTAVPARDEEEVHEYIAGNGDVIAIKDITDNFPISCAHVTDALKEYGYGINEINLITRTLMKTGICNC